MCIQGFKSEEFLLLNKEMDNPLYALKELELFTSESVKGHRNNLLLLSIDWMILYRTLYQISMNNNDEHVRSEALPIMILILLRSNPYYEREKFGEDVAFKAISHLLRGGAGLFVQQRALCVLFLLLNCPKSQAKFYSGCKENDDTAISEGQDYSSEFGIIFEGLADCTTCHGAGPEDLELRRSAIITLAFIASSGKFGFQILLGHGVRRNINFLVLIVRGLAAEVERETEDVSDAEKCREIFKERTLLIREALIFLNRLVSGTAYSSTVLRVLTADREMAGMTIHIANQLSWTCQELPNLDGPIRVMREREVVDLAHVFKKRIFAYLG